MLCGPGVSLQKEFSSCRDMASKLKVREYDGISEDPALWLRHIWRVCLANDWDEARGLRYAEASLVGAAELWFESHGVDPHFTDWDAFNMALVERFRGFDACFFEVAGDRVPALTRLAW